MGERSPYRLMGNWRSQGVTISGASLICLGAAATKGRHQGLSCLLWLRKI
jgi:hypothetical protein